MTNGLTSRLLSVASACAVSITLAGCDPAGFIAGRVGGRVGASVADALPPPKPTTVVNPGGYVCAYLKDIGWTKIRVGNIEADDDALNTIGTTAETARKCP